MNIKICYSGGGMRGFAHLGVTQALIEMGLTIKSISGTSSGAVAGIFLAAGYKPGEIIRIFNDQGFFSLLNSSFNSGLLTMDKNVSRFLRKYLPEKFEDLEIQSWVSATDLLSGTTIYFNKGELIKPLTGSSSIPGLFRPIIFGDYLLCDGGALNNLPIEPLLNLPEPLIAVHVNPYGKISIPSTTIAILERALHLSVYSNTENRMVKCPVLIEPPELKNFKVFDYKRAVNIYDIGYDYTIKESKSIIDKILMCLPQKDK